MRDSSNDFLAKIYVVLKEKKWDYHKKNANTFTVISKPINEENSSFVQWLWFSYLFPEDKKIFIPHHRKKVIFRSIHPDQKIEKNDIPNGIEKIVFECDYNKNFEDHLFPFSLKKLIFEKNVLGIFSDFSLPMNLVHLELPPNFQQTISPGFFPPTLKYLHLGHKFSKQIEYGTFPESLETLLFSYSYNYPLHEIINEDIFKEKYDKHYLKETITNRIKSNGKIFYLPILPKNLKVLHFGDCYNLSILPNDLPNSIEYIKFGYEYNRPFEYRDYQTPEKIVSVLPANLKTLILGNSFTQIIGKEAFSNSKMLESISFGFHYNQPFYQNSFPESLKTLELGFLYKRPFEINIFPYSLNELVIKSIYNHPLKEYVFGGNLEYLNIKTDNSITLEPGVLPKSLRTLVWENYSDKIIEKDVIPLGVTNLTLRGFFLNQFGINSIPPSVMELYLGKAYNKELVQGILPNSIKKLVFERGSIYNYQFRPNDLPNSIEIIHLPDMYDKPIEALVLPFGLIECKFGFSWNQLLEKTILPPLLEKLYFGQEFKQKIDVSDIPESVYFIEFQNMDMEENIESLSKKNILIEVIQDLDTWVVLKEQRHLINTEEWEKLKKSVM